MCGIVGFTGAQEAAPLLLEGLKRLEYRGYDSAGIAVMGRDGIDVEKISGKVEKLCEKTRDGAAVSGRTGIGHTRWATHGAPTDTNAHPHLSNDGRFAVVHNGIIENYAALREELTAKGYVFQSETDTEVIVHLLELYDSTDLKTTVMRAVARLEGSYALGVLCADSPDTLFAVREASPLILGVGIGENYFASDVTALVSYTKNAVYLDDGEFAELTPHSITVYDCSGRQIEKPVSRITWDVEAAEKGGYEHFMLKEIMEQPAAVRAAIAPHIRDGEVLLEEFDLSLEELRQFRKIVITACGSAYYAGCAAKYALEALTRIPVENVLASELRYGEPLIDAHTLLLVISQSGETADTIAAMKECRARGAKALAIVNVVGSTIAKTAEWTIYTWAGPEIAVATTKGYTTQLAVLFLLAMYLGRKLGTLDETRYPALLYDMLRLPKLVQNAIDLNHGIPALAKKYHSSPSLFFIGRNTDWAAALEGALKMKEISYIHAESYAAGELKHGTIALIEEGTPVIAVCCNKALEDKTISNIVEVKARGAQVLAVAFRGDRKIVAQADDVIFIPPIDTLFSPLLAVLPMQLLAYYVAKENGCDIDKPKNLAKSVTVE
ncbi:MAG: glutamine--fructose-6-phosphate transaminase (isomerizing) [Oscillospiraceae bacterium]|nr:glutamine--fructose-6-phosphate transaminase (isomerizing) [Oscillospiraceae bacterium]